MTRIRTWLSAGLFALIGLQSASSYAAHLGCPDLELGRLSSGCNLPGIRGSGFPFFLQDVTVNYTDKAGKKEEQQNDFQLKAKFKKKFKKNTPRLSPSPTPRSSLVMTPADIFDIEKTKFKLKVTVKNGIASGSVKIKGKMPQFGINKRKTLVTAKLEGAFAWSDDGQLLGLNTIKIECNEALPINCTDAESIYLALAESINGKKNLNTNGVAVTTVPLPAAAWLFGSGLLCLAGVARRRRPIMN